MDLRHLQRDPAAFRRRLLIDTDDGPQPLASVMDPWQLADFEALDAGWRRVTGQNVDNGLSRAWLERPRGHSKTSDLAVQIAWALFASRRQVTGVAAAADRDQARLLRDGAFRLTQCNPWLSQLLKVDSYRISNERTGSALDILSSDVGSSYGLTPDFVIADEIAHWRSADLWDSLFSAAAKRGRCLLVVITNAGFRDSWLWPIREAVRADQNWFFHRLDGPQASWITPDRLDEQERLLPPTAFKRLWLNEWSSGAGDALPGELIDDAINQQGPMTGQEEGYAFVAGLDIGVRRDRSAICVLGCHGPTGRIRLAYCQSWAPVGTRGEVDLHAVRRAILEAKRRFNLVRVVYDPYQAEFLAQSLRKFHGLTIEPFNFVGKNLNIMASALLEAFASHNIELYQHSQLLRDLKRLTIVEKSYGFKLESTRDASGHADIATALSIALPFASRRALRGSWTDAPRADWIQRDTPASMGRFQRLDTRSRRGRSRAGWTRRN